jgi:hypothetical protein
MLANKLSPQPSTFRHLLACSEKIREMLKSLLFDEKTKIHNNKHCLTKSVINPLIHCVTQIKNKNFVISPLKEHFLQGGCIYE